MGLIFFLPIVIPVTVIVPFLLLRMLTSAVEKRVDGKEYKKEMIALIVTTVAYIIFLKIFYF